MFEPTILLSTVYKLLAAGGIVAVSTYSGRKLILRTAIEFDEEFKAFKDAQEAKIEAAKSGEKSDLRKIRKEANSAINEERKRRINLMLAEKGIKAMIKKLSDKDTNNILKQFSKKENVSGPSNPVRKKPAVKTAAAKKTQRKKPGPKPKTKTGRKPATA